MDGCDPIVLQAITNASLQHSKGSWWLLPVKRRGDAIYEEIKRLDAESMISGPPVEGERVRP
jgi:hypothetical protein